MNLEQETEALYALLTERAMAVAMAACGNDRQAALSWAKRKAETDRDWFMRLGGAELKALSAKVVAAVIGPAAVEVAETAELPPRTVH
jgi:hypothetical protein